MAGTNKVKQIPVSERVVIENTHEAIMWVLWWKIDKRKSRDESKESRLLSGFKGQELSEDMLSVLVQKVVVMPDGEVEIFWKYKDELQLFKIGRSACC